MEKSTVKQIANEIGLQIIKNKSMIHNITVRQKNNPYSKCKETAFNKELSFLYNDKTYILIGKWDNFDNKTMTWNLKGVI